MTKVKYIRIYIVSILIILFVLTLFHRRDQPDYPYFTDTLLINSGLIIVYGIFTILYPGSEFLRFKNWWIPVSLSIFIVGLQYLRYILNFFYENYHLNLLLFIFQIIISLTIMVYILRKYKLKNWMIPKLILLIVGLQLMRYIFMFLYVSFYLNFLFFIFQVFTAAAIIILTGRKYRITYFYLILSLLTIEIYSRFFYNNERKDMNLVKIAKVENFKFPERSRDNNYVTPTELKYYEYYLFAPYPHNYDLLSITDYYSARKVPASESPGKGNLIIWAFGGSTMLNIETTDSLSIANQIAVNLRKKNIFPSIYNFGVWSYQSTLENLKFQELIKQVPPVERPDIVIFYDGYNDAGLTYFFGAGKMSINQSNKIKAIVEGNYTGLMVFSFIKNMSKISKFWAYFIEHSFNSDFSIFGGYTRENVDPDEKNIVKGVNIYETNTRIIRSVCKEFCITPFFILQPMIYTKKNLTDFEKNIYRFSIDTSSVNKMRLFYSLTKSAMKKYPDFYDFTGILDESKSNDFYDLGHIGPYTGIKIGKAIADTISKHLRADMMGENK
jgi:hypothetical protein